MARTGLGDRMLDRVLEPLTGLVIADVCLENGRQTGEEYLAQTWLTNHVATGEAADLASSPMRDTCKRLGKIFLQFALALDVRSRAALQDVRVAMREDHDVAVSERKAHFGGLRSRPCL